MKHIKRNCEIKVRLSKCELQALSKKVKKTGMSRETYVRTLLENKIPVEIPPAPYYDLMREVHALGNNMHQLAYRAHALGMIDATAYRRNADKVSRLADRLALVCLPKQESSQSRVLCEEKEQSHSVELSAVKRKR